MKLQNSDKWNAKYDGMRSVFWDTTKIQGHVFLDPDVDHITYIKYYAENSVRDSICNQPCKWIRTAWLYNGAVSDTEYNKRASYLQDQVEFQCKDLISGHTVPFTDIYDKGYRAKLSAWWTRQQCVLRPWRRSGNGNHVHREQTG